MQATVATQITIKAAPAEVFKYLSNLKYYYLWMPQARRISSNKPLKLGSRFRTYGVILGITIKPNNEVTKFIPNKEIVIENSLGNVHYKADFHLVHKGNKTVVKLVTSLSVAGSRALAFGLPILKQLALRELRTDLQALKVAAENHLK